MTKEELAERKANDKKTIKYGIIIGIFLCIATNLQQFAFYYSTAGKIAFITAMYMFFVPVTGLFFRKRIPLLTWVSIVLGFVGLYFLSISKEGFTSVNRGDVQAFICALFFTGQILLIEKFSPECDGVRLSCVRIFRLESSLSWAYSSSGMYGNEYLPSVTRSAITLGSFLSFFDGSLSSNSFDL